MRGVAPPAAVTPPLPVVLVHGLWMSRHAMLWLQQWFRRRGYSAFSCGYRSVRRPLDHNAAALARAVAALTPGPIDLVCHSYGGVVVLRMLALGAGPPVRRVVLMGSPVAGSSVGRRLAAHPLGHWLLGQSQGLWRSGTSLEIPAGVEVGAIAGSRPVGLGRLILRTRGVNDGVVAVEETRLDGMVDHLVLDCAHSGMLFSGRIAREAEHFLRHGRFGR